MSDPDPFEKSMVEFARVWRHYGGGSARDIFEQFGLAPQQYFRRLLGLLDNCHMLDEAAKAKIRSVCRHRLNAEHNTARRRRR